MTTLLSIVMTSLASTEAVDLPVTLPADAFPEATAAAPGFDLSAPAAPPADGPPPEEIGKWKGSVAIGATIANGNTNQKTASATADVHLRRERDRTTFGLLWNYSREEGVTTQRRTLATAKYDYFFTKKFYGLVNASGESDLNALLDLRLIFGLGAGYQFIEDEHWNVNGEAGLSYVDENYKVDASDAEFLAARFAYKVEYKVDDKWSAGQGAELYPSLEDKDDVNARVDTHAKVMLTDKMFAQAQWLFTWDNTPAAGAKRTDNLYLLALGWSF
jgi:putative salt-induced outer membrane protein YdiY